MDALSADYDARAFYVADIAMGAPEPIRAHLTVPTAPAPFATLKAHDDALKAEFLSGWSTGSQPESAHDESKDGTPLLVRPPEDNRWTWVRLLVNSWSCLGIVYGDIGTSPIYTISSILSYTTSPSAADTKGAVSLILWSLLLIVVLKYLMLVLEADYHGTSCVAVLRAAPPLCC